MVKRGIWPQNGAVSETIITFSTRVNTNLFIGNRIPFVSNNLYAEFFRLLACYAVYGNNTDVSGLPMGPIFKGQAVQGHGIRVRGRIGTPETSL